MFANLRIFYMPGLAQTFLAFAYKFYRWNQSKLC